MTHTYATLTVSQAAHDEIAAALRAAGYDHAFHDGVIDMHGIGLEVATVADSSDAPPGMASAWHAQGEGTAWIKWHPELFSKCPVPAETIVDVVLRDGEAISRCPASSIGWESHFVTGLDVVSYRAYPPAPAPTLAGPADHIGGANKMVRQEGGASG